MKKLSPLLLVLLVQSLLWAQTKSWHRMRYVSKDRVPCSWKAIHFVDTKVGYAVGGLNMVAKTMDGGRTWQEQFLPCKDNTSTLLKIDCKNQDTCWASGWYGDLFRTLDGNRWHKPADLINPTTRQLLNKPIWALSLLDDSVLVGTITEPYSYWSNDYAQTFRSVPKPGNCLIFHFANPAWGLVYGAGACGGRLYRSEDFGKNWTYFDFPGRPGDAFSLSFVSPQMGWTCGDSGSVLHTPDGGQSFFGRNNGIPREIQFHEIKFFDQNNGVVAGNKGHIYKTSDGGRSWQRMGLFTTSGIGALWGNAKDDIFAGTGDGFLWHYGTDIGPGLPKITSPRMVMVTDTKPFAYRVTYDNPLVGEPVVFFLKRPTWTRYGARDSLYGDVPDNITSDTMRVTLRMGDVHFDTAVVVISRAPTGIASTSGPYKTSPSQLGVIQNRQGSLAFVLGNPLVGRLGVHDATGRVVWECKGLGDGHTRILGPDLKNGIYIAVVNTPGQKQIRPFAVIR